ncbi:MAG: hypothetical protein JW955_21315 [Sedimentisphaerales bacterium]|nr:hypothetical protein [Sedimentisphaerales bacterium]
MEEQAVTKRTNRREMLRLSGMGVLGGAAAAALIPGQARAAEEPKISYASWIHGHSMQIESPDRLARLIRVGWCVFVEGKPGTENWFHFAVPTPVIIDDVRLQADSVMLRFATGSVDAFVRDVHVYDGRTRIAEFNDLNLSGAQDFVRLTLPGAPAMWQALGISVGVGFGVEAMDHGMEFFAAGCDFVVRPSA